MTGNGPVQKTAAGIFIRREAAVGLLTYSPFTGMLYAVHRSDADATMRWLEGGAAAPDSRYEATLGPGWAISRDAQRHMAPRLLPTAAAFDRLGTPVRPLLVNWFITGRCPLACRYCYAEDLMRGRVPEVSDKDAIGNTAESILSLRPLAVVLTGGDPLFSKNIGAAIEALSGRTGIIVDTSGYTLNERHLTLFRKHQVAIRISLDAERPRVNDYQRPVHSEYPGLVRSHAGSLERALSAIQRCLDSELPVTVQTVATRLNVNDLISLGDKLFRLGVGSWRVFRVSWSEHSADGYHELVGGGRARSGREGGGPYRFNFRRLLRCYLARWKGTLDLQVTMNEHPNAVVLVGPDGVFYTESNVGAGKVAIDPRRRKRPSVMALATTVNLAAHAQRYLNLTSHL